MKRNRMKQLGVCMLMAGMLALAPCGADAKNCSGAGGGFDMPTGGEGHSRRTEAYDQAIEEAGDSSQAKAAANACARAYEELRRLITTWSFSFDIFNFDFDKILEEASQAMARELERLCESAVESATSKVKGAFDDGVNRAKSAGQEQYGRVNINIDYDSSKVGDFFP